MLILLAQKLLNFMPLPVLSFISLTLNSICYPLQSEKSKWVNRVSTYATKNPSIRFTPILSLKAIYLKGVDQLIRSGLWCSVYLLYLFLFPFSLLLEKVSVWHDSSSLESLFAPCQKCLAILPAKNYFNKWT